ncbi:Protein of unknown function [Gryllus bimaculatus]|nr:Protein of unknown function [Gryllus bimaculatus]
MANETNSAHSACPALTWSIAHGVSIDVLYQHLNGAKRILMEFNSAYISLATFLLRLLKSHAVVEARKVDGGKRWDDQLTLLSELELLLALDLSDKEISLLSEDNFVRTPNFLNLNFSNNRYSTVPMGLKQLQKLLSLDLAKNPMDYELENSVAITFKPEDAEFVRIHLTWSITVHVFRAQYIGVQANPECIMRVKDSKSMEETQMKFFRAVLRVTRKVTIKITDCDEVIREFICRNVEYASTIY